MFVDKLANIECQQLTSRNSSQGVIISA